LFLKLDIDYKNLLSQQGKLNIHVHRGHNKETILVVYFISNSE